MNRRIFLLAAVSASVLLAEDFTGKVVGITDGDTIRVMHDGVPERIRLWGIECPEAKQPFGTRAKQFTGDLAFCQLVTVRVRDIDRYKRTVAEIILPDGRNLNQELVRAGLAWCYQHYARRELVLRNLEQEAREAKQGLWADPDPVHRGEWRASGWDSPAQASSRSPQEDESTTVARERVPRAEIQTAFGRIFTSEFKGRCSRYPQIERRA